MYRNKENISREDVKKRKRKHISKTSALQDKDWCNLPGHFKALNPAITQNRLTMRLGLFNHGKNSKTICRDELKQSKQSAKEKLNSLHPDLTFKSHREIEKDAGVSRHARKKISPSPVNFKKHEAKTIIFSAPTSTSSNNSGVELEQDSQLQPLNMESIAEKLTDGTEKLIPSTSKSVTQMQLAKNRLQKRLQESCQRGQKEQSRTSKVSATPFSDQITPNSEAKRTKLPTQLSAIEKISLQNAEENQSSVINNEPFSLHHRQNSDFDGNRLEVVERKDITGKCKVKFISKEIGQHTSHHDADLRNPRKKNLLGSSEWLPYLHTVDSNANNVDQFQKDVPMMSDSSDVMKSKKLVSMTGDQLRSKSTATITRSDAEYRQDSTHFFNNSSTSSLIPNVSNLVSPPLALFLKPTSQSRNSQSDASQRTYDFDVDLHNLENLEAEMAARSESHRRETSLQGRVQFWIPAETFDHVQQSNQDRNCFGEMDLLDFIDNGEMSNERNCEPVVKQTARGSSLSRRLKPSQSQDSDSDETSVWDLHLPAFAAKKIACSPSPQQKYYRRKAF